LLIIGLIAGLWVTFRVMVNAAGKYEAARRAREQRELELERIEE
jgi:hypothetical protein